MVNKKNLKSTSNSESGSSVVRPVEGEVDCEFSHIVRAGGKMYCNNCGDWDWMAHWLKFVTDHQDCMPD